MKKSSGKHASKDGSGDSDQAAIAVLLTLADTTWRIFTPVLIMTGLGIWADLRFETKPWLTFIAVALGFALAILLVRAQLRSVAESEKKS